MQNSDWSDTILARLVHAHIPWEKFDALYILEEGEVGEGERDWRLKRTRENTLAWQGEMGPPYGDLLCITEPGKNVGETSKLASQFDFSYYF